MYLWNEGPGGLLLLFLCGLVEGDGDVAERTQLLAHYAAATRHLPSVHAIHYPATPCVRYFGAIHGFGALGCEPHAQL